jgi:SAM-dependent methyltransferase
MRYEIEPLTMEERLSWDSLIAPYEERDLFHRREWLEYLAASRGVDVGLWRIRGADRTLGYFSGGILRKGPFRILGSPLKSWGTNVMGPLIGADVDRSLLLRAFDELAGRERLAMLEMESRLISETEFLRAGYEGVIGWTYLIDLTRRRRADAVWDSLDSTCRNRIRKAARSGLTVEDTDDEAVVGEYYDQLVDVMRRKGLAPPYPRDHARQLFDRLKKADLLFALRVRDRHGRVIATGMFPHDERTMYFWGGASWAESHELCPNDYAHWQAICLAIDRGLHTYNMSGHGRFKRKFGGKLTQIQRWHKFYWPGARVARNAYEIFVQGENRLRARWHGWRASDRGRMSAGLSQRVCPGGSRVGRMLRSTNGRPPARIANLWRAPLHDLPIRDEILYQYFALSSDMDVLEIGPGSGFTAFHTAKRVRHLTLVDVAAHNLEQLRRSLAGQENLRFVCADACAPGFVAALGGCYDAAFALEVFELLPDPGACLENLGRVLRKGGRLLLQFPNYPPDQSPGPTHFVRREDLEKLLDAAGFESWSIGSLRLRPHAHRVYQDLHERPLRLYRRLRSGGQDPGRPLVYDDSWAFQQGRRLERYKVLVHAAWGVLAATMRLGGDCFEVTPVGEDMLHKNLLVLAQR